MKDKWFQKQRAAWKAGQLLDVEMPNSRVLRDYTAPECYRAKGWLKSVGYRIRRGWSGDSTDYYSGKTVGDTFSEALLGMFFAAFLRRELDWAPLRDPPQPGDEITDADVERFCRKK